MSVGERLRDLEKIQRPFSHPFRAAEGNSYLIDNTFAFRILEVEEGRPIVAFVADIQLPILREHIRKDKKQDKTGIGQLILTVSPRENVVYVGGKYKVSLSKEYHGYLQLQSDSSISFEPVSKDTDLKTLVVQRTSSTNT